MSRQCQVISAARAKKDSLSSQLLQYSLTDLWVTAQTSCSLNDKDITGLKQSWKSDNYGAAVLESQRA